MKPKRHSPKGRRKNTSDKFLHYIIKVQTFQGDAYQHVEFITDFPLYALKNEIVAGPCATAEEAWSQHYSRRKDGTAPSN